ncbi:hypothetical protein Q4578_20890, partial [Shimia thalassica]|uniref:hypothetical protein n=1 Tax=Shimia thalassica TaxID=1715693 RepID=UPI0026FE7EF4|nr:hypothetical protein [Shimia thalassica]
ADIGGFIIFVTPGVFFLLFLNYYGEQVCISGKTFAKLYDITPCASAGRPKFKVPSAGRYNIQVL